MDYVSILQLIVGAILVLAAISAAFRGARAWTAPAAVLLLVTIALVGSMPTWLRVAAGCLSVAAAVSLVVRNRRGRHVARTDANRRPDGPA